MEDELALSVQGFTGQVLVIACPPDSDKDFGRENRLAEGDAIQKFVGHCKWVGVSSKAGPDSVQPTLLSVCIVVEIDGGGFCIGICTRPFVEGQPVDETERTEQSSRFRTCKGIGAFQVTRITGRYVDKRPYFTPGFANLRGCLLDIKAFETHRIVMNQGDLERFVQRQRERFLRTLRSILCEGR